MALKRQRAIKPREGTPIVKYNLSDMTGYLSTQTQRGIHHIKPDKVRQNPRMDGGQNNKLSLLARRK